MSNDKPLAGYTVIDFSAVYAGPICARFLLDCGADVIKIEPPGIGDLTRGAGGMTPAFVHFNAGKRSLAIDLKTPKGQQLARDLIRQADIVVQNFRPGIMARFGLDYDSLKEEQPDLIYCSISGFGQSGPWVDRAAFAPIVHAASGFDSVFAAGQDDAEKRPPNWEIMVADILTGAYAFGAIQTALLGRERFGGGEHLDVSMMDAMMTLIPAQLQAAQMEEPLPIGRFYPVKTQDGFVMVTPISNKNFESLCDLLQRPELLEDPRFVFGPRTRHFRELAAEVEKWSQTLTTKQCVDAFNGAGIPCSDYVELDELFTHPQSLERESFSKVSVEQFGEFLIQTLPVRFQWMNNKPADWAAELGQHNEEVLGGVLNLSAEEIQQLRTEKVIP
ncbi:MAG: CoA transferase [Pseudomonadales bacterium]|nr:CoA transferase [Pseudomonadales bacterium]